MDYNTLQMYTIAVKAYMEQRKKLVVRDDFFEILCEGIAGFWHIGRVILMSVIRKQVLKRQSSKSSFVH